MRILIKYGVDKADGSTDGRYYVEIAGDNTETKPTELIASGSIFLEVDTGDLYVFDESANSGAGEWSKFKTVKDA